jgi:AbrB family transcriptional regulator (stage V sporulation protein T)
VATGEDARFCQIIVDQPDIVSEAISTIVSGGDAIGAVILLSRNPDRTFSDLEEKIAMCGAAFLGKLME